MNIYYCKALHLNYFYNLSNIKTRFYFQSVVKDKFKQNFGKLFGHLGQIGKDVNDNDLRSLFFGDYINPNDPSRLYDEITDFDALKDVITLITLFIFFKLLACDKAVLYNINS